MRLKFEILAGAIWLCEGMNVFQKEGSLCYQLPVKLKLNVINFKIKSFTSSKLYLLAKCLLVRNKPGSLHVSNAR